MDRIRNFCIIAHIDHGKSTLADRLLEFTNVVDKVKNKQVLDSMDLEQERWITIKLAPARMFWRKRSEEDSEEVRREKKFEEDFKKWDTNVYQLNLIDTPWHVDFQYEVSRSLASVEGAILLVDATQWVQAQTLSTLYMAMDYDLEIIPVLNKIDLPAADPERVAAELENLIWIDKDEIIKISAKTGENVEKVLDAIIERIPNASQVKSEKWIVKKLIDKDKSSDNHQNKSSEISLSLIFDSVYDPYKGVVLYVRNFTWNLKAGDEVYLAHTWKKIKIQEVGYFYPKYKKDNNLNQWEIGYVVTWLKSVKDAQIWDTIIKTSEKIKLDNEKDREKLISYAIPWFKKMQPFVYAGVYPMQTDEYEKLKASLEKLSINDSAITYEMENSQAFGFGYRCWFLWMLHMDIVKERLSREFNLETIFTTPNVVYIVKMKYLNFPKIKSGDNIMEFKKTSLWHEIVKFVHNIKSEKEIEDRFEIQDTNIVDKKWELENIDLTPYMIVRSGSDLPETWYIEKIYEPFVNLEIVGPADYSWAIMELAQEYRWKMKNMEYIDDNRVLWKYYIPLAEIIVDFHDNLKSITKGYASMNYEPVRYEEEDLVRLDIHINKELVGAFSMVVHKDKAYYRWRDVVAKLKELIPKHMFSIPIQAVIWTKAIARETISALRKDVLAKCYGWDITRKRKLLEKQKEWKKKLKAIWKVNVPNDIFIKMLNRN